jgi:small subunit ribosomal protein S17
MDKTIVVAVERLVRHPIYGRVVRRTKRYKAHDEQNVAKVGDVVELMETRPVSKQKRWRLVKVVRAAR